jgi:hypothetical protein
MMKPKLTHEEKSKVLLTAKERERIKRRAAGSRRRQHKFETKMRQLRKARQKKFDDLQKFFSRCFWHHQRTPEYRGLKAEKKLARKTAHIPGVPKIPRRSSYDAPEIGVDVNKLPANVREIVKVSLKRSLKA